MGDRTRLGRSASPDNLASTMPAQRDGQFRQSEGRVLVLLLASLLASGITFIYLLSLGAIGAAQFRGSCWYAIFFCSRRPDEALRWTERHAHGRVIDTLSKEFPRLKKGYYCAVDGPLPRNVAVDKAQSSKRMEKAPAAYAKEGC